jgi:hypothetical protein
MLFNVVAGSVIVAGLCEAGPFIPVSTGRSIIVAGLCEAVNF